MTTPRQEEAFVDYIMPNKLLERVINWIVNNMEPDQVFDKKALKEWAEENGYVCESYTGFQ